MRPDRITIMISGTLRGTDPLPHADNASTFYLFPGLLHGHRSSAVRGLSCIFSDGVGGIFASSLFGQPRAGQIELARGAAPSNPGPPIPDKEVCPMVKGKRTRPYGLSIRMTAEEKQAVQKRIKESGRSQRDFVLHALLSIPIINNYGLQSLLPELRRVGNNLNQMARRCNQGKYPAYVEVVAMRKELSELWQSLRQLNQEHL